MKLGLTFFLTFFCLHLNGQHFQDTGYVSTHHFALQNATITNSLLSKYRVFLNGELHFTDRNFSAQVDFIKYLKLQRGLKKMVMEYSTTCQYFINEYLLSKDNREDILWRLKPFVTYDDNFFLPLKTIRDMNFVLPTEEKITVECIGEEDDYILPQMVLKELIGPNIYQDSIESKIQFVKKYNLNDLEQIPLNEKRQFYIDLFDAMQVDSVLYKREFDENYDYILRLVEGVVVYDGYKYDPLYYGKREPAFDKQFEFATKREDFMTKHFIKLINSRPNEVFFGQFGRNHCKLQYGETVDFGLKWYSLASRLNTLSSSPVKGQVCAIDVMSNKRYRKLLKEEYYLSAVPRKEKKYLKRRRGLILIDAPNTPFVERKELFQFIYVLLK